MDQLVLLVNKVLPEILGSTGTTGTNWINCSVGEQGFVGILLNWKHLVHRATGQQARW